MSYFYEEEDIQSIKDSVDILDIISEYVDLKRAGSNYKGLCPFHNEKTPSFVVSPEKNIFHCFGCGESGDAITFIMKYNHLDFIEAIEELSSKLNIKLRKKTKNYDKKKIDENRRLYNLNREAAIFFYRNLKTHKNAYIYLTRRGINNNIVDKFGLGYSSENWDELLNYLLKKGYSIEEIDKAGLISKSKDGEKFFDRFRGRIIFPIWDIKNRIIGFGGRLITEQGNMPKYLNSPDSPIFIKGKNLYGLNKSKDNIREKSQIILVEGYMDVISLSLHGIDNAVASLGTALTKDQIKLIKRYSENIIISYDSDNAGKQAAIKAAALIKEEGLNSKIVELEEGMDPDEYLKKYTTTEYKNKIKNSKNFLEFIMDYNKEKYNFSSIEEKLEYINVISRYLLLVKSPVELDLYIEKLSKISETSTESIKKEIENMKKRKELREQKNKNNLFNNKRIETKDFKPLDSEDIYTKIEKEFLNLLINRPKFINKLSQEIPSYKFNDKENKQIYETLIEIYENEEKKIAINVENLSEDVLNRIKEIEDIELNIDENKMEKAFKDIKKKLDINYYLREKQKIMKHIKETEEKILIDKNNDSLKQNFLEFLIKLDKINKIINKLKT